MLTSRSYTMADVDAAERKLREAFPQGKITRSSYGMGLSVQDPDRRGSVFVYEPGSVQHGIPHIAIGADKALEVLRATDADVI